MGEKKRFGWLRNHAVLATMGVVGLALLPVSGILTGLALGTGLTWEVLKHKNLKERAKQLGCKSVAEYKDKYLK